MYKIEIINPCSCAKKRKAWSKKLVFETLDEAKEVASKMVTQGNEKFCKRHKFTLEESEDTINIVTALAK